MCGVDFCKLELTTGEVTVMIRCANAISPSLIDGGWYAMHYAAYALCRQKLKQVISYISILFITSKKKKVIVKEKKVIGIRFD